MWQDRSMYVVTIKIVTKWIATVSTCY